MKGIALPAGASKAAKIAAIKKHATVGNAVALTEPDPTKFKYTQHTFPRICNIIFMYPEDMKTMNLNPSRQDLDSGSVGKGHIVWKKVAADFNDPQHPVGTVPTGHNALKTAGVDPGYIHPTLIAPENCWTIWKRVHEAFARARENNAASGTHETTFENFIFGNLDVLYLHEALSVWGTPDLLRVCEAGREAPGGFDMNGQTATFVPTAVSTDTKSSKSRRSTGTNDAMVQASQQSIQTEKTMELKLTTENTKLNEERMSFLFEKIESLERVVRECVNDLDYDSDNEQPKLKRARNLLATYTKSFEELVNTKEK